jgi:two-component system response regulator YesN
MKALIVDDEKHVREGIKLLGAWEENDINDIYEAGNGEEAIQLIQTYKPEIIFTDMKMPKMGGVQLLEWIKENMPTSKTIVVTGYDDYQYMRKAIHFGSSDYLLKPNAGNGSKSMAERRGRQEGESEQFAIDQ